MGRRAFRMSDKKLKQLRQEEERLAAAEQKKRAAIYTPLFGKPTKPVKKSLVSQKESSVGIPTSRTSRPDSMMGIAAKAPPKVYTGDKVLGIAVMHKSNMVPIFNDDAAVEVAQMRRG